jgi:fructose-specific phosphotransferase system IIC component
MFDVNYLAIAVAAIAAMVVGFLWYSQALFGKMWMKEMKFSKESMDRAKEKGMTGTFVATFIALLVVGFVLTHVIQAFDVAGVRGGVEAGFWVWLGFVATTGFIHSLYGQKSKRLFLIDTFHNLAVFLVIGGILGAWL